MSVVENARRKIDEVKLAGEDTLSLEEMGLTTQQLDELMPSIAEIEGLQVLNLSENSFDTLPESIGTLTDLEVLNLETNDITTLPDTLQNLTNLESIYLRFNDLTAVPPVLTQMQNLAHADLRGNQITTFPRELTNLENLNLDVSGNEFAEGELQYIVTTFPNGEVSTNNPVNDLEPNIEALVQAIYDEDEAEEVSGAIEDFELESFDNDQDNNLNSQEILNEFLSQVPYEGQMADEVYKPMVKESLDIILDTQRSNEDRSNELGRLGTALGNCPTPIRSYMIQKKVAQQLGNEGELTPFLQTLLEREAVEARLQVAMADKLRPSEKIEQVQTMVNSIYMQGAEDYQYNQNLRIAGDRARLESKSPNEQYGFQTLTDDQAQTFAALFCETGPEGLNTNQDGQYVLDPVKIQSVASAYLATKGRTTDTERDIAAKATAYEATITPLLENEIIVANSLEDDVKPLMDTRERKEDLRVALFRVPEAQREETYQQYVQEKVAQIQSAIQKYSTEEETQQEAPVQQQAPPPAQPAQEQPAQPQPELAGLMAPLNQDAAATTNSSRRRTRSVARNNAPSEENRNVRQRRPSG